MLSLNQSVSEWPDDVRRDTETHVALLPGEATCHSFLCVHASSPNTSDHRRIGFAMRFVSAYAHKKCKRREMATLVSGTSRALFDKESQPRVAMGARERDAHSDAMERERCNYLDGKDYT